MCDSFVQFSFRLLAAAILAGSSAGDSDEVKLREKAVFQDVHIVRLTGGKLVFRGISGQLLRKPFEQVEWFTLSDNPGLTAAEHLAARGQWDEAIPRYLSALRETPTDWIQTWIRQRLICVYDQAGAFDKAVEQYVLACQSASTQALPAPPRNPGPAATPTTTLARKYLISESSQARTGAVREALRGLLLELVLFDDVEPIPSVLAIPADVLSDRAREPGAASKPARPRARYGLLPQSASRSDLPRLPSDTFLLRAVQETLDLADLNPDEADRAALALADRRLNGAEPFLSESDRDRAALLSARRKSLAGQHAAAADELLRLSQRSAQDGLRCAALYHAGLAHERMGQPALARDLYLQAAATPGCAESTRIATAAAAKRLTR